MPTDYKDVIDRLYSTVEMMRTEQNAHAVELAVIKAKIAWVSGGISAIVGIITAIVVHYFTK